MADINSGAPASTPVETPSAVSDNTENTVESQVENEAEGAESTEGEPAKDMSKAEKKEIVKQLKKFKLKVDGEEIEEEFDLNNEEELVKRLQLAKVAQKRMQETAAERKSRQDFEKQAEEFLTLLKTNPKAILADPAIGIDLKKFAAEIINEEIEESKKSPEQREKEKLQKELEELRSKQKKEEEDRKAKEFEKMQEEAYQKIDTDITEALKVENLPKKPYVLKKFADLMMTALEHNIELSAKDIAPLVRKQIIEDIQEMTSAAPDEIIEDLLGKDIIGRLRKRSLAKAKAPVPSANAVKQTPASTKTKENQDVKKQSLRDFLKV